MVSLVWQVWCDRFGSIYLVWYIGFKQVLNNLKIQNWSGMASMTWRDYIIIPGSDKNSIIFCFQTKVCPREVLNT